MLKFSDFGNDRVSFLVKRSKPVLLSAGIAVYEIQPQWTLLKDML